MNRQGYGIPLAAVLSVLLLVQAGSAVAKQADYVPGELLVKYTPQAAKSSKRGLLKAAGIKPTADGTRRVQIADGLSVQEKAAELSRLPEVSYAVPNYIARITEADEGEASNSLLKGGIQAPDITTLLIPDDPGDEKKVPGAWRALQWNFLSESGVSATRAWANLILAGKPGGEGTTVAVLDTGVAYGNRGRFRRSPDFEKSQFARGYDFVDRDSYPNDENGHGTHVSGTVAERTDNGVGVTGLAYNAKIMPIRVLDEDGAGSVAQIKRGIEFAVKNGADVINLSFEFGSEVKAEDIPDVISAMKKANRAGVLVVAAAGNEGLSKVSYPARSKYAVAVGATTVNRCLAEYSNRGRGIDLVAPGGGIDAEVSRKSPSAERKRCKPYAGSGPYIYQMTYQQEGDLRSFGLPDGYEGTSMAAPHVAAGAALIKASGVLGSDPSPAEIVDQMKETADDLGKKGYDSSYGHGLLNVDMATRPVASE